MRLRSTGLGNTELEAEIAEVKRVDDVVVFIVNTTKPVRWRARMVFQQRDLRQLVSAVLRPKNLWYIIRALVSNPQTVPRTESL